MKNNLLTFQELQLIAIKNGVPDNKTEIGIWAKNNGYFKIRKQKDKILVTVTENAVISVNESAVFSVTTMQHFR